MPKRKRRALQARPVEGRAMMPSTSVILMLAGIFVGYFGARLVTPENAHPLHWGITVLVAALGYVVGLIWYHIRGDITL